MSEVAQFRADIESALVGRLREFCNDRGMTQKGVASKIFSWFLDQSPVIQQSILGQIPEEIAPDVARMILERMAIQDRPGERPLQPGLDAAVGIRWGTPDEKPPKRANQEPADPEPIKPKRVRTKR